MLKELRSKIEEKRNSNSVFWKPLVFYKDFIGKSRDCISDIIFFSRTLYFSPFKSLSEKSIILKASQIEEELSSLVDFLKKRELENVLEIGTNKGGTFYLWCKLATKNASIITLDLEYKLLNGRIDNRKAVKLYSKFKKSKQRVHFVLKDSHKEATLKTIEEILNGDKLDFLFIDGDHSYEGIKQDFEMYSVLVNEGGIIALHDIVPGNIINVGPPQFWKEIKSKFKHIEIVKDWNQGGYGIGVIIK